MPLDRYVFVKNDPEATKRGADAFWNYFQLTAYRGRQLVARPGPLLRERR